MTNASRGFPARPVPPPVPPRRPQALPQPGSRDTGGAAVPGAGRELPAVPAAFGGGSIRPPPATPPAPRGPGSAGRTRAAPGLRRGSAVPPCSPSPQRRPPLGRRPAPRPAPGRGFPAAPRPRCAAARPRSPRCSSSPWLRPRWSRSPAAGRR